jgi:hypothetical protein
MRNADDGRENVTVKTISNDKVSRSKEFKTSHRLGPSTLVLSRLAVAVVVDFGGLGELPVHLVVGYVADAATKIDLALAELNAGGVTVRNLGVLSGENQNVVTK